MNSDSIFREIFDQFVSLSIYDDWRALQANFSGEEEKRKIQRIIVRVACCGWDMFEAGKEIEALNPSITSTFPQFLLKFITTLQMLPGDQQTPLNTHLLLKICDFSAKNSKYSEKVDFGSNFREISRVLEFAGDILIKDLIGNAVNLYPESPRALGARDLLDGLILSDSEDLEAEKYKEAPFLRLKQKV